jgi:hypothetical protein
MKRWRFFARPASALAIIVAVIVGWRNNWADLNRFGEFKSLMTGLVASSIGLYY